MSAMDHRLRGWRGLKKPEELRVVVCVATFGGASVLASRLVSSLAPPNCTTAELRESAFLALLGQRTDQFDRFRHFPADFVLQQFAQRDVRCPEVPHVANERTAQTAAAGIQLAHPA